MAFDKVNARGLVLVGAGRMGGAMLRGWLAEGLSPAAVTAIDPHPAEWLLQLGVTVNRPPPENPAVVVIAVKPQMMGDALGEIARAIGPQTLVISIAAGVRIARFEEVLPPCAIVRSMPNTPAAIGKGITALIGNTRAGDSEMALAETLLSAVGETVRLETEDQLDAVTGVSGSGPAYVFHLIEALAAAGEAEGLAPELALALARATVAGAGALAMHDDTPPAELRRAVTSPNGTTQAGLEVLMDEASGLRPLIARTVAAATARSRELGA